MTQQKFPRPVQIKSTKAGLFYEAGSNASTFPAVSLRCCIVASFSTLAQSLTFQPLVFVIAPGCGRTGGRNLARDTAR
jgi:hypothetical protein